MITPSWTTLLLTLPSLAAALPFQAPVEPSRRSGLTLPIERRRVARGDSHTKRDDGGSGAIGIGDLGDLYVYYNSYITEAGGILISILLGSIVCPFKWAIRKLPLISVGSVHYCISHHTIRSVVVLIPL